jgi:hypothetical protein
MDNSTHTVEIFHRIKEYDIIKVTTFKESGKHYDSFELKVTSLDKHNNHWYRVLEEVKQFRYGHLQNEFTWVIECVTRNDSYPAMLK